MDEENTLEPYNGLLLAVNGVDYTPQHGQTMWTLCRVRKNLVTRGSHLCDVQNGQSHRDQSKAVFAGGWG